MREIVGRHLGKVVAGAAVAAAATAVLVGVNLPEPGAGGSGDRQANAAAAKQDAVAKDGVIQAAPEEGAKGVGSDPLTDEEIERAEKASVSGQLRAGARDVAGDRGPQLLSTNLSEPDPDDTGTAPRRAEVVYYDYKKDAVITKTVNLETGKVDVTATARHVQPPPSQEELAEGARLLIADPLGTGLKKDFRHATGKRLTGPDQLQLSGMVFRKETVERVPAALDACGTHRCLQVVTKVKNGPWIDTRSLVVDLSTRKVGRLG
ncbi:Tat pathway signal sequence domain protein [Streptomyces sp. G44]|uniref:Tat pathway signal sequence domain protein n=1 Tax=Streptomyces sp. G44 TaxID=2807632 RepID=UPI0019619F0E|nr:Tat pathway signal sequence domain protein [Streptomyces sp. G44]MBM7169740.1 Tat pathway signal sequence domain protein [Streptomyces sp. G44]